MSRFGDSSNDRPSEDTPKDFALYRLSQSPLRKARQARVYAEVKRRIAVAERALYEDRKERALEVAE
jgi:hypothetical protein